MYLHATIAGRSTGAACRGSLERLGIRCGVVSGGFIQVIAGLAEELGLDFARANTLGEKGWTAGSQHHIRVDYATTRIDVSIPARLTFWTKGSVTRTMVGLTSSTSIRI